MLKGFQKFINFLIICFSISCHLNEGGLNQILHKGGLGGVGGGL